MAKGAELGNGDKIRVLKALAFRIHKKTPAADAMAEVLDQESMGGRHRVFRPAKDALDADGVVAAMTAIGLVGDEAGAVMAALVDHGDHRLLSDALGRLADRLDR